MKVQPTIKESHMSTDHIQNLTDTPLTFTQKERDEIAVHHYLSTLDPQHWFDQIAPRIDEGQNNEQYRKLSAPGILASTALWYADQGIAVFPLQPNTKTPMPGSRGFKDATTNPEQITAWWKDNPKSNIGIPTGHHFDVLDIDGAVGFDNLQLLDVDQALAHVITPRPGLHISQPVEQGAGNAAGILPGIDYRGLGGYVVAPPSIIDGALYEWVKPPLALLAHING